jgi:MFS family permease
MDASALVLPAAQPRTFRQNLLAMLGLCGVLVMVALDQTVIGTALPTVVAELHGFELYAWVGTSYLLASVVTIPIFGKLGNEHGRRPFVIAAIVLFTLASMLCGASTSMAMLVLMRVLQGLGGGMLISTSFASIPDLFPEPRERLRWQVLFSAAWGIANAIGPTLGGYLAEFWGWRWVFFVNLPVGLLSLWLVWRHLPHIRHVSSIANGRIVPHLRVPNVMVHLGLLMFGAAALALTQTGAHTPPSIIATMMLGGLGLGLLLPNLTLFIQACAPRRQLGSATAMMQTTRMVGGMLGTAFVGTLVTRAYEHGNQSALAARHADTWQRWLDDPQVLVNPATRFHFEQAARAAGQDAASLVALARDSLVGAIHLGQGLVLVAMAAALLIAWRMPAMTLRSHDAPPADDLPG